MSAFPAASRWRTQPCSPAIAEAENALANTAAFVIRPSGTEPLIRVMAEGDDQAKVERIVNDLVGVIGSVAQRRLNSVSLHSWQARPFGPAFAFGGSLDLLNNFDIRVNFYA